MMCFYKDEADQWSECEDRVPADDYLELHKNTLSMVAASTHKLELTMPDGTHFKAPYVRLDFDLKDTAIMISKE